MLNSGSFFNRIGVKLLLSVVTVLITIQSFGATTQLKCGAVLNSKVQTKNNETEKVNWLDDASYIKANQLDSATGVVQSYHSETWNTQVYFTATGLPNAQGKAPLVDPNAKAVFLFIHGSGTSKSSGKNFVKNMNTLANIGYSSVSIDLPFHANGPRTENMHQSNAFMEWMRSIVLEIKKSGKPIILAGHSYGPDVILEFLTRYPKLVDAAVALSPAAFNKVLEKWYDEYTSKMKFGDDVPENQEGGEWAHTMSKQFLWPTGKLPDPTLVNPNLIIRILSGNMEEYVPAPLGGPNGTPIGVNTYDISQPLKKLFSRANIVVEPGIGHYLFEHTDSDGFNVVTRELLAAVNVSPTEMKKMAKDVTYENANYASSEQLALKYSQDPLFKSWADLTYGEGKIPKLSRQQNDKLAKKILDEFYIAQGIRELEIHQKIINTKNTHPEFYNKYKTIIDSLNPKRVDSWLFVAYRREVLGQQ